MEKKSRQNVFAFLTVMIGLFAGLIACEAIITGVYWAQDGEYLSVKEKLNREKNTFVKELTLSKEGCSYIDVLMPHPYVAFVMYNDPCQDNQRFNRAGFLGQEFPLEKLEDKFVILLTGGSVAAQLAGLSGHPFQDFLANRFGKIDGKEIIVLNGALGAWRQPQQAILFLLYAEVIDAVITLDGFNEYVTFRVRDRLERPYGGRFRNVNPHLTLDYKDLLKGWITSRLYHYSLDNWLISKSKLAYFLSLKLRNLIFNELENVAQRESQSPESDKRSARTIAFENMFSYPINIKAPQRFQKNMQLYKKYTSSIHTLSRQMGIKNLHFIQPAPAIGKELTQDEINRVGDLGYGNLYQKIANGLMELKDEGVPIFSLLQIFKNVKKSVYVDSIHCEHKVINGKRFCYDMMSSQIADQMVREWKIQVGP